MALIKTEGSVSLLLYVLLDLKFSQWSSLREHWAVVPRLEGDGSGDGSALSLKVLGAEEGR